MRGLSFAILLCAFSLPAHAQSFDGSYEGKILLIQGGAECGEKSESFALAVKGKTIRIVSPRAEKPFVGEIREDGQLFAKDVARGNRTLEWRAQILATKTGLGTMLETGSGVQCQFLVSLKRN